MALGLQEVRYDRPDLLGHFRVRIAARPYHGVGSGGSRNTGASNTSAAARFEASCPERGSGSKGIAYKNSLRLSQMRRQPKQIAADRMRRVVAPLGSRFAETANIDRDNAIPSSFENGG